MHFLFSLSVFIPLISGLVPVQNREDALIPFLVHEFEDLKGLVGDLKSKLESAEKKDSDFANGLTTAENIIKELTESHDGNLIFLYAYMYVHFVHKNSHQIEQLSNTMAGIDEHACTQSVIIHQFESTRGFRLYFQIGVLLL